MQYGVLGEDVGAEISRQSRVKRSTASRQALALRYATNPDAVKRYEARMARLTEVRRRARADKRWCILRTSARSTLPLSDSLEDAGFDVWTPVEIGEVRVSRTRDRIEKLTPVMPSFVFAAEDDASNLLRLSLDPTKDHADFSLFHYHDRVPLIRDGALSPLREHEADAAARRIRRMRRAGKSAEPFDQGETVKMANGAFGGLPGIVEQSDGRFTLVCFEKMLVKIDTFILRSDLL